MSWGATFWLAVALGMDAFAVSLAVAAVGKGSSRGARFRLSFHFGLFQGVMPVIGWVTGSTVAIYIQSVDHWIAFGLLGMIGGKMIAESFTSSTGSFRQGDPTRGWSLVLLSVATSIDALAVGLSLAIIGTGIWLPALVIGLVATGMTLLGIQLGGVLNARFGKVMELAGGLILIGIGVRILITHLI